MNYRFAIGDVCHDPQRAGKEVPAEQPGHPFGDGERARPGRSSARPAPNKRCVDGSMRRFQETRCERRGRRSQRPGRARSPSPNGYGRLPYSACTSKLRCAIRRLWRLLVNPTSLQVLDCGSLLPLFTPPKIPKRQRTAAVQNASALVPLRLWASILSIAVLSLLCGCASGRQFVGTRSFNFETDTFAFPNELDWVYHYDANGKWVHERREPKPEYQRHCFVLARSARQFFQSARFDPDLPEASDATYRRLIRQVVSTNPRHALTESEKIIIPGYRNLRAFSEAKANLLKDECGGTWESYIQRGHWRMVFPFSRASQKRTAERLLADLQQDRPPVIHLVRFPKLSINHAMLVFGAKQEDQEITFLVYDPNHPERPGTLNYERADKTFLLPANNYFPGGRVDVYEVYRSWDY